MNDDLPDQFTLKVFKGKSVHATGANLPPGARNLPKTSGVFLIKIGDEPGEFKEVAHAPPKLKKLEVWLCAGPPEKRIRKLHEAIGPNAQFNCDEFIKNWRPDAAVTRPPECPADGKVVTAINDTQMELL